MLVSVPKIILAFTWHLLFFMSPSRTKCFSRDYIHISRDRLETNLWPIQYRLFFEILNNFFIKAHFWIGKFLIKMQRIVVYFYLGYWNQPWFGQAGSEKACIFCMRKMAYHNSALRKTSVQCHLVIRGFVFTWYFEKVPVCK